MALESLYVTAELLAQQRPEEVMAGYSLIKFPHKLEHILHGLKPTVDQPIVIFSHPWNEYPTETCWKFDDFYQACDEEVGRQDQELDHVQERLFHAYAFRIVAGGAERAVILLNRLIDGDIERNFVHEILSLEIYIRISHHDWLFWHRFGETTDKIWRAVEDIREKLGHAYMKSCKVQIRASHWLGAGPTYQGHHLFLDCPLADFEDQWRLLEHRRKNHVRYVRLEQNVLAGIWDDCLNTWKDASA